MIFKSLILAVSCMRGKKAAELLFDPETEKAAKANRKRTRVRRLLIRQQEVSTSSTFSPQVHTPLPQVVVPIPQVAKNMVDQPARRTLGGYVNMPARNGPPIVVANNIEIKSALLAVMQQNQCGGSEAEDPNVNIANFVEICSAIPSNGVVDEVIKLRLFPFSLRDKANKWLQS